MERFIRSPEVAHQQANFDLGQNPPCIDALNTRLVRLQRVMEKAHDTEMALGSDVMVMALEGYAFLKIAGKGEGLHGLRKTLGKRFENNGPRKAEAEPVLQPA